MNKARNVITEKFTALFLAVITLALVSVNASAAESGDSSTDAVKKPEKCYELVTGGNEEYYSKITINSRSVLISGCYKNDPVTDITLQNCGTVSSTLKVNPDGTFTSVLNPSEPIGSSDRIVITLKSGAMLSYLIMYDDNRYFPDNKLGKQNLSVLEKAVPTSAKSWAGYVTDELTEEGVKQTLDEVAYLADYIAGDIKDDYKKLEAIAKWVSDNIYYDRDARENSVTQSEICIKNVLKSRKTVCVGYSALFSALCEAQGLYVVNVKGTANTDTYLIHVSEQDYQFVSMQKTQIAEDGGVKPSMLEFVEDRTLGKNECLIETPDGIYDCSLSVQLSELKRKLLLLSYSGAKEQ